MTGLPQGRLGKMGQRLAGFWGSGWGSWEFPKGEFLTGKAVGCRAERPCRAHTDTGCRQRVLGGGEAVSAHVTMDTKMPTNRLL